MYTAYLLEKESREYLLKMFPPKYGHFLGHHITVEFGVTEDHPLPKEADIHILSHVDSGDGIECFLVSINDSVKRPDGGFYHLTWSLKPERYKPVDSNRLLKHWLGRGVDIPILVRGEPQLLR